MTTINDIQLGQSSYPIIEIPLSQVTVLRGGSGAGKTQLICGCLSHTSARRVAEIAGAIPALEQWPGPISFDSIHNLAPAMLCTPKAKGQRIGVRLGVVPELVRLLTRLGVRRCPGCRSIVDPESLTTFLNASIGRMVAVCLPLIEQQEAGVNFFSELGYRRALLGDTLLSIDEISLGEKPKGNGPSEVAVVLDLIKVTDESDASSRVREAWDQISNYLSSNLALYPLGEDGKAIRSKGTWFDGGGCCHSCGRQLVSQAVIQICPVCAGGGSSSGRCCDCCNGFGYLAPDIELTIAGKGLTALGALTAREFDATFRKELEPDIDLFDLLLASPLRDIPFERFDFELSTGELTALGLLELAKLSPAEQLILLDDPLPLFHEDDQPFFIEVASKLAEQNNSVVISVRDGVQIEIGGNNISLASAHTETKRVPPVSSKRWTLPAAIGLSPLSPLIIEGGVGAGKTSSLERLKEEAKVEAKRQRVVVISEVAVNGDQSIATAAGIDQLIAKQFASTSEARTAGLKESVFNLATTRGRCESCDGAGGVWNEGSFVPCEECFGLRFKREALAVLLKGRRISDIYTFSIKEAIAYFAASANLVERLQQLIAAGLGAVQIGGYLSSLPGQQQNLIRYMGASFELAKEDILMVDCALDFLDTAYLDLVIERIRELHDSGIKIAIATRDPRFKEYFTGPNAD